MQDSGLEGSWKELKPDAVPRAEGSAYALQTFIPLSSGVGDAGIQSAPSA